MSSQKLKTALTNVPPVTRGLTAAIITISSLALLVSYSRDPETTTSNHLPVFGLVPG
jgi:hypothetical protein